MKWKKLGKVFCPDNVSDWMFSHAANAVAVNLHHDVFRVYFSCRNRERQAHIGYVDIDIFNPQEIINIAQKPVLSPGEVGTFDDSGVSLACIKNIQGRQFMYYLGWNLGVTVPWRNAIGLAILNGATGEFERYSQAPIADRNDADPFSLSYPYILEDDGVFKMYYGSNLKWGSEQKDMAHLIKYGYSHDGIHFIREGKIALHFKDSTEYAMSRPCVIKEEGIYKMWYSYRGLAYRIGYAESQDSINWERKDGQVGISISPAGWDSEIVCYPFVFDHKGRRLMLYNGNHYGLTGFGLAELVEK
jgi:hypothetical protein